MSGRTPLKERRHTDGVEVARMVNIYCSELNIGRCFGVAFRVPPSPCLLSVVLGTYQEPSRIAVHDLSVQDICNTFSLSITVGVIIFSSDFFFFFFLSITHNN